MEEPFWEFLDGEEKEEAPAAEVPRLRVDDGERQSRRDGRVDRVAAFFQDRESDLGRERLRGDDGPVTALRLEVVQDRRGNRPGREHQREEAGGERTQRSISLTSTPRLCR